MALLKVAAADPAPLTGIAVVSGRLEQSKDIVLRHALQVDFFGSACRILASLRVLRHSANPLLSSGSKRAALTPPGGKI
jgi:hypothetical protein